MMRPRRIGIKIVKDAIPPIGFLILGIVLWQVFVKGFKISSYLVPTPSEVAVYLFDPKINWVSHFLATTYETLAGLALGVAIGIALAIAVVHSYWLNKILYPYILLSQVVPKVAVAPLFFIWFGFGPLPKVLVAFLISFFPMVIDSATGLHATDPELLDLLRSLRASWLDKLIKVRLPIALPYIFSGLKVAVTLAVIGAVIGEFIAAEQGLGYLVIVGQTHFVTPLVFASLVMLVILGLALFVAVVGLERVLMPWYSKMKRIGGYTM